MASVYDRSDIYDLFDSPKKDDMTKAHWKAVLSGLPVRTALDVSIGTGSLTLPLAALGVSLYGSDLSETMLTRCREKAAERGLSVDLRQSDFRALTAHFDRTFDCVMSTGNSLAYVPNSEITGVLEQMDALVAPGGVLYFDLRNWDRIVRQKQRFYFYDPAFLPNGDRVNLMQVWDHLPDGSITFHLLYTFERAGKIFQKEHFEEHYYPAAQKLLLDKLAQLGYEDVRVRAFPVQFGAFDPERSNWYCVLARKITLCRAAYQQKQHELLRIIIFQAFSRKRIPSQLSDGGNGHEETIVSPFRASHRAFAFHRGVRRRLQRRGIGQRAL